MSVVNPAGTFINGPDGKLEAKYVQGKKSNSTNRSNSSSTSRVRRNYE